VKRLFIFGSVLFLLAFLGGGVFAVWGYYYITRDLPRIESVKDFRPPAVSSVYARDGTLVGEFFSERRYPVNIKEVPPVVRNAFLAAEDANFYTHPGIDVFSILRAVKENLAEGRAKQGASTITQQVVKNILLTPEKKLARKVKEALLAYQIEKALSKDEILEIYLNSIFFGNTAYGIKAAARLYFRKELSEVTLAEAAILAGLPKAPSKFSPTVNPERSRRRQQYVLGQMVKSGFVTQAQASAALREDVKVYAATAQNIFQAPYYVSEVRRILGEQWRSLDIDRDGLTIYTALDAKADKMAQQALRSGLRDVDKRRGWRGPLGEIPGAKVEQFEAKYKSQPYEAIDFGEPTPALVREVKPNGPRGDVVSVYVGGETKELFLKDASWAVRRRDAEDRVSSMPLERALHVGDVIEVSRALRVSPKKADAKNKVAAGETVESKEEYLALDQTPDLEGAITLLDPFTGEVLVALGGYDYGKSVFNRATQSYRQPGSAFKPIVYLAAVDGFNYTPATLVDDRPRTFRVGDQYWTPSNFDEKFLGDITLRVGLEKSRNLVSADLVSRIGVDAVLQYAKKLGIESRLGRNLSIALGSSEVTLLELSRAYGPFPAKGVLCDSTFITKIIDRDGKVLFDFEREKLSRAHQVISEPSAFIMANMMKGVVQSGTAMKIKELQRPAAGKTGTSNDQMDTWFIGFTPHWVAGVWVGFDLKKNIGAKETGGHVAAPIWLYFMKEFLGHEEKAEYEKLVNETKAEAQRLGIEYIPPDPIEPIDFGVPDGVEPYLVVKATGQLASEPGPGVIQEYFVKGTQPSRGVEQEQTQQSYLESPEL
jgi:penicillin-binding protein 1A